MAKLRVKLVHAKPVLKDQTVRRIHFEDQGQDFLYWDIDSSDEIVGCEPFQSSIWTGNKLSGGQNLIPGHYVRCWSNLLNQELEINYPIERVEILTRKEVNNG